ncbi:nucleotide sugar dehydrogenase [Cytobacillus horneckiae]|uniref:nucleotide sugar dehydrogenase n=1 Tax=Cytobacillus horneckiae TaxID=549687 RepID=UPI0034CFDA7D
MSVVDTLVEVKQDHSKFTRLKNKILNRTATVAVVGLGYVGLPNVVSKASDGFKVIAYDLDINKVESISKGVSYIKDVTSDELSPLVTQGRIIATNDGSALNDADIIAICVPTPIDEFKQPNLNYIKSSMHTVLENIKPGTLVMLESTTYPGTTEEYIVEPLMDKGLTVGEDVFVAYSPERIDPSNKIFNVDNTPRIVGGHTPSCGDLSKIFLGKETMLVTSTKIAEMSKVYENTFRYVNIALANELALICDKMDMDAWEVIEASSTKPFGFMPFYPSAGVGGHCIPVDPYYLSYKAKEYDYSTKLIDIAGDLDIKMKEHTIGKIIRILNEAGQPIRKSKIAILGVTYKKDVNDLRESFIHKLLPLLEDYGARITLYDPHVSYLETINNKYEIENINYRKLKNHDLTVILTDHSDFDYEEVLANSFLVFDTKNACKKQEVEGVYYKL